MFRIAFTVEDKHLAAALRAVSGKVHDLEVMPVANANVSGANSTEMFINHLRATDIATIAAKDAQEFLSSIGRSPASYNYLLQSAAKAGGLKRVGKTWKVVR